jgi:hypothetical protein
MYASKPTDVATPESSGRSLLVIASALALIDGLLYLLGRLGTAYVLPKLRALTTVARYFAAHTTDPAAQLVIEALRNEDIYLYRQLIAARDTLLAAHDQYVYFLWRTCFLGFVAWCAALLLFRLLQAWHQAAHAPPPCTSPMGIQHQGRFVPCPLPVPGLARVPLSATRLQRWAITLGLRPARTIPPAVAGLSFATPLARALIEHYLASPGCPAEIGSGPSPRHGEATLLDHVLGVRAQALVVADDFTLPAPLAEQVALGHDLGKLATFHQTDGHWVRVIRHHDRMSSLLLTALPEWQALPADVREEIRRAVRFHGQDPTGLPPGTTERTKRLVGLISHVHKKTSRREVDAASPVPPPVAGEAAGPNPVSVTGLPPPPDPPAPSGPTIAPAVSSPPSPSAPVPPAPPAIVASPEIPTAPAAVGTGSPEKENKAPGPRKPNPAGPLLPVDPTLQDALVHALGTALPQLRINATQNFSGLTLPEADLVMLLDPPLRAVLAQILTPEEAFRLKISAREAQAHSTGSTMPVPHAADANLAAALRRLGWLVERHRGQTGTLWKVRVGRRIWLACWLLDLTVLPRDAIAGWFAKPSFTAHPVEPSWVDPYRLPAPQERAAGTPPPPPPPARTAEGASAPSPVPAAVGPPGRITPGFLLAASLLAGAGWFAMHPPAERTTLTCETIDTVAQWVRGEGSGAADWDLKVKDAMDSLRSNCPRVLETVAPAFDKTVESAKEHAGSTLHLGVGTAKQIRNTRQVTAVIDGSTLKIGGLGEARLLGITVPPETQGQAKAFLGQMCLKDGAARRLVVHVYKDKDAEGYPLVVVYADHGPADELRPELAINQQLMDRHLAQPWSLGVCTDLWSNHQPKPAECTQG